MLRQLFSLAARRAAADPRLRAKAAEVARNHAKPLIERKLAGVRDVASKVDPRDNPAYFAGRVMRRLLDD